MRQIGTAVFALVVGLGFAGCASKSDGMNHDMHGGAMAADGSAKTACPMCAKGMAGESVWCDHCNAGFAPIPA